MKKNIICAIASLSLISCNLDQRLNDSVTASQSTNLQSATQTLAFTYSLLDSPASPWTLFSLNEDSTDEYAKPTRGSDWYDGGRWQQMHLHTWTTANVSVTSSFDDINKGIAYATQVLGMADATAQQKAEATFLRVYYLWLMTDNYGQTILREPNETDAVPSIYWTRDQAIDKEIAMLEAVVNDLPSYSPTSAFTASKNAAYAFLAKLYLNKAVYKATDANGMPQLVSNSNFQSADMDKVISYANQAMAGASFTNIAGNTPGQNYFQNFAPNNGEVSTENIFTKKNTNTNSPNVYGFVTMCLHYNQNPSGWNGPVILPEAYNRFTDPNDGRLSSDFYYASLGKNMSQLTGLRAGILVGQQYNKDGGYILTRQGAPLAFTKDFDLSNSDETRGMRVDKYLPDYFVKSDGSIGANPTASNDFVFLSYSDCLMMKAEAYARKGDLGTAQTLVNQLRVARGAAPIFTGFTLNTILDERGREFYHQGFRRDDQIRFGTFLNPVTGRTSTSDPHVMIYPIPLVPLNGDPKMHQNPGY